MSKIYHYEIFGLREKKYNWLNKHSIKNVKWKKIVPFPEFYLFQPTDNKLLNHYSSFPKITEIFPINSVGIVTARDNFTIGWTKDEIWKRIKNFVRLDIELARQTYKLGKDARDWKVELAQQDLRESDLDERKLAPILYRPFDYRYTYYTGKSRGFHCMPRDEVMGNILSENLALITIRRSRSSELWNFAFISDKIISGSTAISSLDINYCLPLYIYSRPNTKKKKKFAQLLMFEPEEEYQAILPNISKDLISSLVNTYGKPWYHPLYLVQKEEEGEKVDPKKLEGFASKNIFYYIYAILYSNTYRKKYEEFLKIDFPRIPFTKDYKIFIQLGKLGKELADLHLLKSKDLENPAKGGTKFPIDENNKVEKLKYTNVEAGKVFINKSQFFYGVTEEVWNYQIGGYQVCEKWLKDKKGRTLTLDEIKTYCKIVTALSKTIELQKEIDKIYEGLELSILS